MSRFFGEMRDELVKRGIKPSHQRLKVLEYLLKNRIHPTVDQIYIDLHPEIPTLSKSTVYNTLNIFVRDNLVRVINIEDNETRYDINTKDHGHFKCEACTRIFDFQIDTGCFATKDLEGFLINDRNVYFKGVCPDCLNN